MPNHWALVFQSICQYIIMDESSSLFGTTMMFTIDIMSVNELCTETYLQFCATTYKEPVRQPLPDPLVDETMRKWRQRPLKSDTRILEPNMSMAQL